MRVGDLATLVYEVVPRNSDITDGQSENKVKEGLSEEEYTEIATAVLSSDLDRYFTSMQNRNQLIHQLWYASKEQASELIAQIEAELAP